MVDLHAWTPSPRTSRGEGRGEGRRHTLRPAQAAAPHPSPLPTEEWGEGAEANAIAPNKRMLSSMTPAIVLKNGKPYIVLGTPGGTTIPTSVYQTLVNMLEFNLPATDAVWKPKFHHQWQPDEIFVEKGFPDTVMSQLKAMGYKITVREQIGRTEVIKVLPNKKFEAVADNRGNDAAEGF